MELIHKLSEAKKIELSSAISRHSADELITYKKVNGQEVCLGYYFPQNYDKQHFYPTFLMIHGGGWASHAILHDQACWKGDHLGYLARYYADKGFVCVSIDYRLTRQNGQAPGYEIIDCYEDCCDAVDYVIRYAKQYAVDIDNMYLLGESAGGHLAGALASFDYDRKYSFQKLFLVNPITHFEDNWMTCIAVDSIHQKLRELSLEEKRKFMAPLFQCNGFDGEVILIHGLEDTTVNPEHSNKLYNRMQELFKPCSLHWVEDTSHAFLLAEYYKHGLEACYIAIDIINQQMEGTTEED